MTELRKHDRLKVVDDTTRIVIGINGRQPVRDEVVTVSSVAKNGSVQLVGFPLLWRADRFEMVERAVGHDKDEKPLYVGDTVTVTATRARETKVLGHPVPDGQIPVVVRKGSDAVAGVGGHAHFSNVSLVRHHWEHPILGFDGTTAEGNPFVVVGYMDEGGMKTYRPRPDVELIQQMEAQIRRWNTMFGNYAVPVQSNHALGKAVDVPVQLNWDDVVIGSVVQVRVRATGEEFTAEVTESPNGTKKGQEPSPHVHGIWTGTSIVRKCWELLRNDLPVKTWADGSVILLGLSGTARREMHRIKGTWIDAMTGKTWADTLVATYSYEIVRDAERES